MLDAHHDYERAITKTIVTFLTRCVGDITNILITVKELLQCFSRYQENHSDGDYTPPCSLITQQIYFRFNHYSYSSS